MRGKEHICLHACTLGIPLEMINVDFFLLCQWASPIGYKETFIGLLRETATQRQQPAIMKQSWYGCSGGPVPLQVSPNLRYREVGSTRRERRRGCAIVRARMF